MHIAVGKVDNQSQVMMHNSAFPTFSVSSFHHLYARYTMVLLVVPEKVVLFRTSCCIPAKVVVLGRIVCIRVKVVVFGQSCPNREKWLYSGKSGCFRAKVVLFE